MQKQKMHAYTGTVWRVSARDHMTGTAIRKFCDCHTKKLAVDVVYEGKSDARFVVACVWSRGGGGRKGAKHIHV